MLNFKDIHPSWKGYLSELNMERFLKFREDTLDSRLYYPKAEEVFNPFKIPVEKIKCIIIESEMWNYPPHRELIKAQDESNPEVSVPLNYKSWEDQGILVLPVALTLGPNLNSMFPCWDWIMSKIFIALSTKKDLIWMFKTYDGALKLGKYIHKQKVVNDSLEAFITNKESNLVIKHYNNKKGFSLVNAILHNKKEKEIIW